MEIFSGPGPDVLLRENHIDSRDSFCPSKAKDLFLPVTKARRSKLFLRFSLDFPTPSFIAGGREDGLLLASPLLVQERRWGFLHLNQGIL